MGFGYADFLPRILTPGSNFQLVDSQGEAPPRFSFKIQKDGRIFEAPPLGMVSMDLTTINLSEIPEGILEEGDLFEIIGPNNSLISLAQAAGTTPYEILTRLTQRGGRRYISPAQ